MMTLRMLAGFTIAALFLCQPVLAEGPKKIQDNSFLIEEAYNQEPGVVQHIQSFQYMKGGQWLYTFTQEWPVPRETHQLSYTVPVLRVEDPARDTGLGDLLINYRYQAVLKEGVALSPRFSLALPSGDHRKGMGAGSLGYQVNLPLSVELNDRLVTHWNLGWTFTPDGRNESGDRADTLGTNYGASLIYLASESFNLMLEVAGGAGEEVAGPGQTAESNALFLNPGMRFALNFASGLQIVPGLSFPLGIGPSEGEYGVLAYLSFEHPLF